MNFKYLLFYFVFFLYSNSLFSQTYATNFTTTSCDGEMYNLFDSLDIGKVVVIAWVMPCSSCINYAQYAVNAVNSLSSTFSEKVDLILVDDYGNTLCSNLIGWANANSISFDVAFSSTDINMLDYGTIGMPKIVVLGGNNHYIYYNQNSPQIDYNGIFTAISEALSSNSTIIRETQELSLFTPFPNPANNLLNFRYNINHDHLINRFEIINIFGEPLILIGSDNLSSVSDFHTVNIDFLDAGIYFLNFYSNNYIIRSERFIVRKKK